MACSCRDASIHRGPRLLFDNAIWRQWYPGAAISGATARQIIEDMGLVGLELRRSGPSDAEVATARAELVAALELLA